MALSASREMLRHVVYAPTRGAGTAPVVVEVASKRTFEQWSKIVQPKIAEDPRRLDREWNWQNIVRLQGKLGQLLGQQTNCYTINVPYGRDGQETIPGAMILVCENFPALDNHLLRSSFVWYLSTAPASVYKSCSISEDNTPDLGRICIDIATTLSFGNRNEGRLGLHADPAGGHWLYNFYWQKCELRVLASDATLPGVRKNDGRYFFADVKVADVISRHHDKFR